MSDTRQLRVPADDARLDEVLAFVGEPLEDAPMKVATAVAIAAEEIFVNIAHYAYGSGKGEALVTRIVENDALTLRFEDWGAPYNPLAKPDPDITLSAERRDVGGLGIYMVKKSMDSVEYAYEGRNILTLTKRLQSE